MTSTMNTAAAVFAVCVFACLQCSNGQLVINLGTGSVTGSAAGVSWVSSLTAGSPSVRCGRQGVVKLTYVPGVRERYFINMTFAATGSQGFTFDLGDSATNNGYAGDADTSDNDAEVHTVGSALYFYGRDTAPGVSAGLLHTEPNFVGVNPNLNLNLEVKDQLLRAHNGNSFVHFHDYYLFQLNGQPDRRGVNYDLYFSMNRVISSNSRSGSGLCRVVIQPY